MRNVVFATATESEQLAARRPQPVRHVPRLQLLFGLLRNVCPIFRFCVPTRKYGLLHVAIVTQRDDVEEVLMRSDVFKVPFAKEMETLTSGSSERAPFVLSVDDRDAHDEQLVRLMQVFKREDAIRVAEIAFRSASALVDKGNGQLDAIGGLITEVPIVICERYLGVQVRDHARFAEGLERLSGHLFGPPPIEPKKEVNLAADYVRGVVDDAIQNAKIAMANDAFKKKKMAAMDKPVDKAESPDDSIEKSKCSDDAINKSKCTDDAINKSKCSDDAIKKSKCMDDIEETVMSRILKAGLSDSEARTFLLGLIVGFVPTNTIAGGHILDLLLRVPGMLNQARAAANSGDDVLLGQCLFEALRYSPINWGPFRLCARDYVLGSNTWHKKRIRKGAIVLAATQSAMFDRKRMDMPYRFMPERPAEDRMHFSLGIHWCVGAFVARAQLVQTFKPLLMEKNLTRAKGSNGKLRNWPGTIFPQHLMVQYGEIRS